MKKFLLVPALLPAALGVVGAFFAIRVAGEYGFALFLVLPFAIGFSSGFLTARAMPSGFGRPCEVALFSLLLTALLMLTFALDGFVCIAMAFPLAAVIGTAGSWLGWYLVSWRRDGSAVIPTMIFLAFPLLLGFETSNVRREPTRAVTTSVTISASPQAVWAAVIDFPEIPSQPAGIFRLGLAAPLRARIVGSGVGAIRYCEFTTGSFVEPITTWESGHTLEFSVASNPPPMFETSPYGAIHPPHLSGYLTSHRGRFRIVARGGVVTLEGTTWYSQELAPAFYWGAIDDFVIHQIHLRVLRHIKSLAEAPNQALQRTRGHQSASESEAPANERRFGPVSRGRQAYSRRGRVFGGRPRATGPLRATGR